MEVLGILGRLAGRGIAPFLKHLIGPWILAKHDVQAEIATAAHSALTATFPGDKFNGALQLYAEQVLPFACCCNVDSISIYKD